MMNQRGVRVHDTFGCAGGAARRYHQGVVRLERHERSVGLRKIILAVCRAQPVGSHLNCHASARCRRHALIERQDGMTRIPLTVDFPDERIPDRHVESHELLHVGNARSRSTAIVPQRWRAH